ncbi:FAD-binding oxidoreductase [Cumulibacter manganitolerans]|uniref:FAD-binding oxidoreductase n=1 Tax=Cumulibacter manganitolerans TaxID=1884992 RepID=UPI001297EBB4|nr:FAD-linked oxidase C-terminal domain-containing protein [Cumulibacter manganitolerans]
MPVVSQLRESLPAEIVIDDPDVLATYAQDHGAWARVGKPACVVRARGTADVQAVVRACIATGTPVVARGAGTGLSGGANATDGCVVLSLDRLDRVLAIDPVERIAVVQPGVVNNDLRAAVAEHGLWYPPDPASAAWSTIGGNVATNAGGLCCVKYGVTREYVLGMEVVNGLGEIVRLGRRTAKGVAGYDLTALLVGSEGTLGIVTEVTLRLLPARLPEITVAAQFDTLGQAADAITGVARAGIVPSVLELLDAATLKAVDDWKNLGVSAEGNYMLLANTDVPGESGQREAAAMQRVFDDAGAGFSAIAGDQEEVDALFAARRLAYFALERHGPVITEDVCVPKAKVPAMIRRLEEISAEHDVYIATLAHAGDGNLHPCMPMPPDAGEDLQKRALAAFDDIIDAAIELGGTVTGEHGVGLLKMAGLAKELGPEVIAMHRAVKAALDPHGILNPGKIFT